MTTLICSGTLFSGWRKTLKNLLPAVLYQNTASAEFSVLSQKICLQQFPDSHELDWKPFTPDKKYINKASQSLSSIENEPLFVWGDNSISLYLNFWKTNAEDAKFILFYSSPEFELSNYIRIQSYEITRIEMVIDAWLIRTQAMLTFFMNNRDRCLLVSVQSAGFSNGLFIQTLNKQFDLDLAPNSGVTTVPNENTVLIEYLATTLLLKNQHVSELYDELRSTANLISDQDKSISGIEDRNKSLINEFVNEVVAFEQLNNTKTKLEIANNRLIDTLSEYEDEFSLNQLQIKQMAEELEYFFKKSTEKVQSVNSMADYLRNDPLLRVARQARQMP